MKNIIFDSSSHLGQFCTTNEDIRRGCKNMQASISPLGDDDCIGQWTDLENGRTDRAIWNLQTEVQDAYYPVMDRYYSITNVEQQALSMFEEDIAYRLVPYLPRLSPNSRHTCARAIVRGASEIHTLFKELLSEDVVSYMASHHNITIHKPQSKEELSYKDAILEERYQTALKTFRLFGVNPPAQLDDKRSVRF
ncbi:MAG: DUF6190 family protein [bacterium]|nr:DUF6190 family protein [bacterium]